MEAEADTRAVLLVTTVDIGDGKSGRIEIREGDVPEDAAREFCRTYGLPESIVGPLSLHILENIEHGGGELEHEQPQASAQSATADPASSDDYYNQHPQEAEYASQSEPPSPTLDCYLPDDSPIGPTDHPAAYPQPVGQPYRQEPPATAGPSPYPTASTGQARRGSSSAEDAFLGHHHTSRLQAVQSQQSQRPASAPEPQEGSASSRAKAAAATAPELKRPASVNSNYSGGKKGASNYGPSSSAGSGGSSSGRPEAYSRLYADHFSMQTRREEERRLRDLDVQLKMQQVHVTPVSQQLACQRNAIGYKNYGERLYVEGRLEAMRKEKEAERIKQLEQEEKLSECVFKPEISKMARTLKAAEGEGSAAWQRLYQRSQVAARRQAGPFTQATAERMEAIKKEQEEEEVRECTFRPKINHKSAKLIQDRQAILRDSGIPGFEQLFNDSIRRRIKQDFLARQAPEEATFHPRINTSSVALRHLVEGRQGAGSSGEQSGDVSARLLERGRKYNERLQQAREVLHGKVDPSTGKPLYQPQTCRAPKFARNPAGQPIGEYLYSIQQERQEKMSQVLDNTKQRADANASSVYVNKRSEKLVEKLKRERFRAIFDYLGRGESEAQLNLVEVVQDEAFMDTIDPEVRADIEYAAKQLSKYMAKRQADLQDCADSVAPSEQDRLPYAGSKQGEVNPAGFHALMEEVLQKTSGISRQYLLPMPTGRKKFEEPTFQPAIDPKSKMIAARRRPEHVSAYEVLYKTAEEVEHKRVEKKKIQEQAELEECVFNPKLQSRQLVKEGKALKLAATLSLGRRGQDGEPGGAGDQQTPLASPSVAAAQQELRQFDTIERQIQDALVRLSISGEAMAAAAAAQAGGGKSCRGSIDHSALFGSPTPAPASSMGHYNPLDGGDSPPQAAAADRQATLEWCESGNDLVATIINQGGGAEVEGLNLHAIASASIEVGDGLVRGLAGSTAGVAAAELSPAGSSA